MDCQISRYVLLSNTKITPEIESLILVLRKKKDGE